jgi:bifunctional enzyme CysN/CysC
MKSLLKFLTCGSVDDGKSTLLGHLLYDAKLLFADQEDALLLESKVGSRGGEIDYSLLLDGLAAEREQGITIDVAYRYFTTDKRSFIAADCPGHEEYTRNMAVGAGFADVAVILLDATRGVLTQTRRHTRICALMGIKHFVYAVNKMDLVGYREVDFNIISKDIKELVEPFGVDSLQIIPVSATEGDNVVYPSRNMTWYDGPTLQTYLEDIDVDADQVTAGFSLPIQRVCRPTSDFRGFQGTVATGHISVGDAVKVLPSGTESTVKRIVEGFEDVHSTEAGHAVNIALADEVDVSRGSVLVKDYDPMVTGVFTVKLLWMDDAHLVPGKNHLLRIGTETVSGTIVKIKYKVDVNTGEEVSVDKVEKNEIAVCDISLGHKVVLDRFQNNAELGRMIFIDRVTHMTSGCAVVEHKLDRGDNLTWHDMDVTRELREGHMGQKAFTLWFTGLSGSGKSTLANAVEKRLYAKGNFTMLLDGDNVRMGLNKNLGFSEEDRVENIRRIAECAKLMNDSGLIVLTSFISPFENDRQSAREIIGQDEFIEIYVSTPLEECERRDVKDLYKRARAGEIRNFTGITSPYEAPINPELSIDTSAHDLDACVDMVVSYLEERLKA